MDRDLLLLNEIYRWRFCLSRHLKVLCDFGTARAVDRRLKILSDAKYIERNKVLYGVPSLCSLTHKGRVLLGVNKRPDKIRLEQITHDIAVLDVACRFILQNKTTAKDIITEKEMHSLDGFGQRSHRPDFIYQLEGKKYAVEIEMSLKAKTRLEAIVKDNYLNYDGQLWIIPDRETKINKLLKNWQSSYDSMTILSLEMVINGVL